MSVSETIFAQMHESNEPIEPSLCAVLILCNEGFIYLCLGSLLVIQVVTEIVDLCIEMEYQVEFKIIKWNTIERRLQISLVIGLVISIVLALIDPWGCLRSCHASLELLLTFSLMI